MFSITIPIDIGDDTEKDFINQIISTNEGDAIQTLANGKALDFLNVSDEAKRQYVLNKIGEQFSNIYENGKDEAQVIALRNQLADQRKARKGGK